MLMISVVPQWECCQGVLQLIIYLHFGSWVKYQVWDVSALFKSESCRFRVVKSPGKKSDSRGRSKQRKAKKTKGASEEDDDDEGTGTYILLLINFFMFQH